MSYCIFAITMPDMFGLDPPETNPLTLHLLEDTEDDRGICRDFLLEAISRFDEDDTVPSAIVGAVEELSRQLSRMSMNDNYKPLPIRVKEPGTVQTYSRCDCTVAFVSSSFCISSQP